MRDRGTTSAKEAVQWVCNGEVEKMDANRIEYTSYPDQSGNTSTKVCYSINLVAWGLLADAAYKAEHSRKLGALRYDYGGANVTYNLRLRGARVIVNGDESRPIEDLFNTICIHLNCSNGRGFSFAPAASAHDGLMDVLAMRRTGRCGILALWAGLKKGGRHVRLPKGKCQLRS
jgi:diacylglycerol kinase family enzyme